MRLPRTLSLFVAAVLTAGLLLTTAPASAGGQAALQEAAATAAEQRSIELQDILEWKRINSARLSNDGAWLAYRLAPTEGNSELVVRATSGDTEHRFAIGEVAGGGFGGGGGGLTFADDSAWLGFTIYPQRDGAAEGPPARNKLGLLNLASGEMAEYDEVRGFAFSGDNSSWLAMHKYAAGGDAGAAGGGRGARGGRGGGGGGGGADRARGADLILLELASGTQMNIGNVAEFAFDEAGDRLAWVIDTASKAGNGVQMRIMDSGVVRPLDSSDGRYSRLSWSEDGDALAALKGIADDDYEEPLNSVVGFTGLGGDVRKIVYDPREDDSFPTGMTIAASRSPSWSDDLDMLVFGIVEAEMKDSAQGEAAADDEEADEADAAGPRGRRGGDEPEKPDLVIWHWKDDRLQSQQQVQENRDRSFSYLAVYHIDEGSFVRLADDTVRNVTMAPGQRFAIGNDNARYELMGNLDGRRYQDVYAIDSATGDRTLVLERARWYMGVSPAGSHLLYYEDGDYHTYEFATGNRYNISENVPTSFINTEDDHNVQDPPIRPIGWTKADEFVLLYDNWDIWKVAAHGDGGVNLTVDGRDEQIRYRRRFVTDPDEEGVDLSKDVYLAPYGEWTKQSGIGRIAGGGTGVDMLLWGDAAYSGLIQAEDADVFAYTLADNARYPDYYVTDASFGNATKVTEANPQQTGFQWSAGARLVDYESDQGDKLQAALFLPADYQPGRSYPTIVYIYEKLSQGLNNYAQPSANGFNQSVYTSNGYAVLMPDIVYKVNDPGMSAVWCVLPALDAAIATGVVDADKVGLHGHSWGGYQTSFLITQTDRFAAAVAGAPLTNMISMYSSIYWNTGGGNMAIFESSQGRFTGDYLEATDAYIRNSPVFFADRVKTPLILLHNDQDGAVDWNQGIEYYNTLRRLGKDVVMLQYVGENHGLREPANRKDYTVRMREFFDHHLKGVEAPEWLLDGVPHLKMDAHLEERSELVKPKGDEPGAGGRGSRRGGRRQR